MTTLTYYWKHLPTGTEGQRTIEIDLPAAWAWQELNERLANWNRDERWKYWR